MIVSKDTLNKRFHDALWSPQAQTHLDELLRVAARGDIEYAKGQVHTLVNFIAAHVVDRRPL